MRTFFVRGAIRTVAVSPDGRFVAVSARDGWNGVCDWHTGTVVRGYTTGTPCDQFAFAPDGSWVASVQHSSLWFNRLDESAPAEPPRLPGTFVGGVAVSPDGKKLVAVDNSGPKLAVWELPSLRPQVGFDGWLPARRLAFSRNGEFVAGIWPGIPHRFRPIPGGFELRFARSGGRDYKYPPMNGSAYDTPGFVSFTHDSSMCAFGWSEAEEFHVLDLSTGTGRERKYVRAPFRDAAFTGSGQHFATVEDDGTLKLWDVRSWEVVREYDWQCGPLTCLAFTADGSAGVCGTADGHLVQFDVDE